MAYRISVNAQGKILTTNNGMRVLVHTVPMTTELWLDAHDSSTITESSYNVVSQWDDKSGNNRHVVQSVEAAKPSLHYPGQFGLNLLKFDGNTQHIDTVDNASWLNNEEFTVFAITLAHTYLRENRFISCFDLSNPSSNDWDLGRGGPLFKEWGLRQNEGDTAVWYDDILTTFVPLVTVTEVNDSGSHMWLTGKDLGTQTEPAIPFTNITAKLGIGGPDGNGFPYAGSIGEVIIMTGTVTTAIRQRAEGYLAWKWTVENQLPVDHPYKDSAPSWIAPANTVLPVISGNPYEGEVLTSTEGTWTGDSLTITYQWQNDGVDIVGETSSTYTATGLAIDDVITCDVTATNYAAKVKATSNDLTITEVVDTFAIYSNITIY